MLSDVPANPDHAPDKKYGVAVSLWLAEKNHWLKIGGVAEMNE
jgi:hypothetical protein